MSSAMENITASKLLEIVSKVQKRKWYEGSYQKKKTDCRCALGIINFHFSGDAFRFTPQENQTRILVKEFLAKHKLKGYGITNINDSDDVEPYTQSHPKDRILHLLRDMVEAGY